MTDERYEPADGRAGSERNEGVEGPGDVETGDPTSTTGAAGVGQGEPVGRLAGADPGYAGETGAERRAEAEDPDAGGPL
jgi:hypothetical protein